MSKRPPKEKRPQNARATTVAKLRRMGAFNGGGTVEERLRSELAARDFGVAYLLPLARTGRKVRTPFDEHNANRAKDATGMHEGWQRQATALWAQPQHAHKNKSDVARLIDPDRWNTVRHFISNPKK